jgi:hypothetical protein
MTTRNHTETTARVRWLCTRHNLPAVAKRTMPAPPAPFDHAGAHGWSANPLVLWILGGKKGDRP